jgi:hypothetical protein
MRSRGKRRGGVIAWMLDDVELRELRIFLAVLVAAMRETGAQRRRKCRSARQDHQTHGSMSGVLRTGWPIPT